MSSSTAFKEWEAVCAALGKGRQTILLRKGGIHEGREGFSFKHERFYLFPTKFHAQSEHIREEGTVSEGEWEEGDKVPIHYFCVASQAITLKDWDAVEKLHSLHIYTSETLRERFYWEGRNMAKGSIHVALVRTYQLHDPIAVDYGKRYAGCRSWIDLPAASPDLQNGTSPVISDAEFSSLEKNFVSLL